MIDQSKILALIAGCAVLALASCGPPDAVELKIQAMEEADHWSLGGNKTCRVSYQILNNKKVVLQRLTADFIWRDAYGEDVSIPIVLESPLPPDKATRQGHTPTMYGSCDEVELVGIRNVAICEMDGLDLSACQAELIITHLD